MLAGSYLPGGALRRLSVRLGTSPAPLVAGPDTAPAGDDERVGENREKFGRTLGEVRRNEARKRVFILLFFLPFCLLTIG